MTPPADTPCFDTSQKVRTGASMGPMTQTRGRSRPGRPRHIPQANPGLDPREQLLDVSARLFVANGFAATSTREIAESVGIRQASLYYHFQNKEEILEEVVRRTIRPTLDRVVRVEEVAPEPPTALYLLALLDVRTLARAPHNSGLLGLLPDVAKELPELQRERAELAAAYGRLGDRIAPVSVRAPFGPRWGFTLLQMAETAISWRSQDLYDARSACAIAGMTLRMCAVPEDVTDRARAQALPLVAELEEELD